MHEAPSIEEENDVPDTMILSMEQQKRHPRNALQSQRRKQRMKTKKMMEGPMILRLPSVAQNPDSTDEERECR